MNISLRLRHRNFCIFADARISVKLSFTLPASWILSGWLNVNEIAFLLFWIILQRYDILSDGLEDVAVDNNMNKQTTLEDEEALDAIDGIWQEEEKGKVEQSVEMKYKVKSKTLITRPYVYEPLKHNCDSHITWNTASFRHMLL